MSERLIHVVRSFADKTPYSEPITLDAELVLDPHHELDDVKAVVAQVDEGCLEVADEEVEGVVKIGDFLKSPTIARALGHGD